MSDHVIECLRAELAALREQLAERDAEIAALKGHAEAMAYRIENDEGKSTDIFYKRLRDVAAAYRAAYPKEADK